MKFNSFELITALITPFKNNKIDYLSLKKIITYQLENNISSFVLFGTTGEGHLISLKEKIKIIKKIRHDFPSIYLIIGVSELKEDILVNEIKLLSKLKIDALLVLTPYYLKTNSKGLINYYSLICSNSKVPIYIYNVPKRTGQILGSEELMILKNFNNIIGIKDASTNKFFRKCLEYKNLNFQVYSGEDLSLIETLDNEGNGLISVISNAYPKVINKIINLYFDNKKDLAIDLFNKYKKLFSLLFEEPNPIPIKYLMSKIGFSTLSYRFPMYYPSEQLIKKIDESYLGDET